MVEMGWPSENINDLRELSLRHWGKHTKTAVAPNGVVFQWTQHPPKGYEGRHARMHNLAIGTVVAHDGGFAMVVPEGGPNGTRQPVFPGPHTNHGQPCGGYGCDGGTTLCDDCQWEVDAMHREQMADYYSQIGPLNRYERYGEDDW